MLMACKPGCAGKKGSTNGLLDKDKDEVVCEYCSEILPATKFTKLSMKQRGEVVRNSNKKSYSFPCLTCKKTVETELIEDEICGKNCNNECEFQVTEIMYQAMKYKFKEE